MTKKTQQQRFLSSKFFDTYVHMYRNDDLPAMRVPSFRLCSARRRLTETKPAEARRRSI